jgi:hypothetical protein
LASSESGQIWVRTHCPEIYALSRSLRCEAKKTGQVLVRTSGCEKGSDFSHGNGAMSGDLKLSDAMSAGIANQRNQWQRIKELMRDRTTTTVGLGWFGAS